MTKEKDIPVDFRIGESPFRKKGEKPTVFITHGDNPYDITKQALENIDLSPAKGKKVLLKPNIGRIAEHKSGVVTDPLVTAAAIDAFRAAGAEVSIGESPITGVDTMEAFEHNGTAQIARKRKCPLIDMDARRFVPVKVPNGKAIKKLKLCPELLEFDIIVSIPVMKTHMHTGVTLSIKNMKGCLWRRSKVDLHMLPPLKNSDEKPINAAIADMSDILTPHLAIIDGTTAMEGIGPSAGQSVGFNTVLVSAEPFAADAVACALMGIQVEKIPHLAIAASRGYGIIDLDKIEVQPGDWRKWERAFEPPPQNIAIDFPNVNILDKNSCSACQSTLLLFLKRYGDTLFDYFPDLKELNIAIGKGHTEVPIRTLCIGNCAAKHKNITGNIFVPGCPPVGSKILSAISKKPSIDVMDGHSQTTKNEGSERKSDD